MRHKRCTEPFVLMLVLAHLSPSSLQVSNVSLASSGRGIDGEYKYLIFPQGSNVQLVYCLTIGTYAKPESFFTMGVTAGLAYELPHKNTVPHKKPAEVYHRRGRRDLYHKLEMMFKTQGKDGRVCILKALCQAGKRNRARTDRPDKRSFLEEILHSIFTFPAYAGSDAEEGDVLHHQKLRSMEYDKAYNTHDDCDKLFPSCPKLF